MNDTVLASILIVTLISNIILILFLLFGIIGGYLEQRKKAKIEKELAASFKKAHDDLLRALESEANKKKVKKK